MAKVIITVEGGSCPTQEGAHWRVHALDGFRHGDVVVLVKEVKTYDMVSATGENTPMLADELCNDAKIIIHD